MAKKSTKSVQEASTAEPLEQVAVEVAEPGSPESEASAPEVESKAGSRRDKKRAKRAKATKSVGLPEREAVLDLEPGRAADIKPVRAGTHLARVLELTARNEGATAVELDKAIVTTAKSVKHYGIWTLRYALHKNKQFGFRTIQTEGERARYHLVLPKGEELSSFLKGSTAGSEPLKAARLKSKLPVRRPRGTKASKSHGKKAAAARA